MLFNCLAISLLVMLHNFQLATSQNCTANEVCVLERNCPDEDEAGRGHIRPAVKRICAPQHICCDLKLLSIDDGVHADDIKIQSLVSTTPASRADAYESCGTGMECVPRFLCNGTINDSGRLIIRVSKRNALDGKKIDQYNNVVCKPLEKCCKIGDTLKEDSFQGAENNFQYHGCGYSNPNGLFYHLENEMNDKAAFAEFPWTVAIMIGREQYVGGGVLIHPKLVITTAHSIANHTIDTLILRAGEWDLHTNEEHLKHQNRRVERIFIHEEFEKETLWNDIALLVVSEPFELMPHVQPICLPAQETEASKKRLKDANCVATGWGRKESYNESHTQSLLKRIDLPIVGTEQCNNIMRQTLLGKRFWLRPSFLCAGGEYGKDICRAGGGSPLSCTLPDNENRYELTGLVSWNIGCGEKDKIGVYVNIPYLRSWIDEKSLELGITITGP